MTALALSMSLSVGMQKAQADVTVGNWSDLRNAIQNATGIITLDDAINPGLIGNRGSVEVGASNLTIDGQNKELTGTILGLNPAQHIILNSGRTLNITNLTQSQYERFLYNNNGTVNISSRSSFSNNDASAITGGEERAGAAIYNAGGIINILDSSFSGNQAYNGGAIANAGGTVVIEKSTFDGNHTTGGNGGAIDTWGGTTTIIDSSFTNNHANDNFDYDAYARGDNSDSAQAGGAINNNNGGTLNIVAQNDDVEFTNNYVGSIQEGQWPWDPDVDNRFFNAITNNGTINLNASDEYSIIFNDSIGYVRGSSREGNIININKSDVALINSAGETITTPASGTIAINNAVYDQTVNMYGGTLHFGTSGGFDDTEAHHVNLNIHGGLLDAVNGEADTVTIGWTNAFNDLELALDADAGRNIADYFSTSNHFSAEDGISVNISKVTIINSTDNRFVGGAVDSQAGTWKLTNVKEDTILLDADGNELEGNTLVSWNKNTGVLKAGKYNLKNAVSDNNTITANGSVVNVELNSDRIYRLVKDEIVSQTLGDMTNGSLTIAGNGNNITALTGGISGITTGAGDTLTINDVANMSGFDTALNVTGGTVSLDNSDITNNTVTGINVSGGEVTLTNGSDITGNTTGMSVSGGTVTMTGGMIASNDNGLTVSGGSATLTDSDIVGNDTGLTVTSGNVTINASAGDSAESLNTVAIDNAVGENVNNIENSGTINFNAFANAVIEVGDNVIRAVGNTVNGILSINTAENASGTVNLADVSNQTVNINKGTVTTGNVSGSDVNVTTGNIDIAAVDNSTVDITDGTADFGTVSNNSTVTIAGGTANFNDNITSSTLTLNGGTNTIADNKTVSSSTITVANGATANIAADLNDSDITTAGNTTISGDITGEYNGYAYTTQITNSGTADISGNVSGASIASIGNGNTNLTGTKVENSMIFASSTVNLGTADGSISLAGSIINGSNTNLIASTVTGGADGAFTINDGSTLSSAVDSTIAASILGSGNINNTGGELNFATTGGATGANFTGTINATAGTINLGANYGLNTGANINLAGGTLNYATGSGSLSDNGLFGLALNGNGTANINGSGRETANITLTDKFWTMNNTGNTLNFNDANYILANGFTTGDDILNFNNSGLSFEQSGQNYGNIAINNSILNLSNRRNAGDTYTFETLNATGTNNFSVDVDLYLDDASSNPIADKIIVNSSNGGKLTLTELFITNDNGVIGQVEGGKNIQLIQNADGASNPLQLEVQEGIEILSWATNVYEYGVTSASSNGSIIDSINIAEDGPSSTDTLRDLNMYVGGEGYNNRGFSFVIDGSNPEESNRYNIYRDLDTTTEGTFTILGRYDEHGHKSVLSGELKELIVNADSTRLEQQTDGTYTYYKADGTIDKSGLTSDQVAEILEEQTLTGHSIEVGAMGNDTDTNLTDKQGSMFELRNATNLKINDVSIEDAKRYANDITITDGAAIYASNSAATVELENTDFKNNSVKGGNGGAIANINSESFSINNALFENNSAGKNGGAIYNADDMTIGAAPSEIVSNTETMISAGNTSFAGNTAVQGGAIYNAQNAEMTISSASSVKEINGQPIIIASTIEFTGNAAEQGGAIYNAGILNMKTSGDGKIIVDAATKTASNDIYNVGTLNLNGDITINSAIKDAETASGTTNLNGGTLTLGDKATITQKDFNIASGVAFTTNADKLSIANLITNAGRLEFIGGENKNAIKNTGSLAFNGATATSGEITGAGNTTIQSGTVANTGSITQNGLSIALGAGLTTNADNLTITSAIQNAGTLTFTGGENANAVNNTGSLIFDGAAATSGSITGTGNTTIQSGTVENTGSITQNNLSIALGAGLTTNADNLTITSAIQNAGTLTLSGTLDKTISGAGTTSINGELALVDGVHIDGTLAMNNGTLDLNEGKGAKGKITEHNIGKLTGTGTIKIDADLSANAEEGDSDTLNIVGSAENASINIYSINVTADHVVPTGSTDDPYDSKFFQVIGGDGKDNVNLTLGGNDGKVSTITSDYLYEFVKHETNNGAVKVNMNKTTADLADFIQGTNGTENIYTYSMTRDETKTTPPEIGTTNRTDIPADGLNLYLNGHTLSSGQASGDGITVAGGYTLNVTGDNGTVTGFNIAFTNNGTLNVSDTQFENNQNALTNNAGGNLNVTGSTFADNDTAITNNAGGNLNLSNITFDGNGVDVSNSGTLNLAGNTVIEGGITGQGTTNITSGVTNAVNTIVQNQLNISAGATLDGANNVTASISNEGIMNYGAGTANSNTITGNGTLNAQGNWTNDGNVSQGTVNVASGSTITNNGTLEVTNTLNNTDSTIANAGELNLAGQNMQNNGTINGSGTTNISGSVQNNGTIEQDVEITQSGELTSSADNIKNNILNNGVYNITGGTIANAITGSGDLNLSSNMTLASSITGNNINLNNGILSFAQSADISSATLSANGGSINLQNGAVQNTNLGNLILNSDLNLMLDGSFADKELDTITANSFTNNGGHSINISNILLSTPTKDMAFSISPLGSGMNDTVSTALAGAIQYTGGEIVYSPIYKYSAKYDPETALLNFNRVGGGGYDSYNPGVFAGAVAAQLGGYLTQLNSYDEAFRNMDMYMLMTQEQRQAMKMRNKYAAASADSNIVFDPTITQYENKAGWFRPYATFEKVDLKGGPTVSNVAYGSFFGAESEMYDLGHGWDGIWGVYGGYNGSHQSYDGVGIYQNGGTLGAIGMAYKGNFFTGLTANVGANSGEASTMYGQDNFTLLMSGVASKSGYNWELAKGKFIIQPNFLISYSYVNTFNYRDAQGVGIESDPLHAIQIEPGIKLIGNLKNGWQPYASVSMVWNIMDKTQFQANYVSLPELSVKPFVKYGVGVRKSWGERFTGFFQTYFTNGGRNGVGLQLGLRFMLGKSPKKTLNGPVPELKKTVIKVGRK